MPYRLTAADSLKCLPATDLLKLLPAPDPRKFVPAPWCRQQKPANPHGVAHKGPANPLAWFTIKLLTLPWRHPRKTCQPPPAWPPRKNLRIVVTQPKTVPNFYPTKNCPNPLYAQELFGLTQSQPRIRSGSLSTRQPLKQLPTPIKRTWVILLN